jgi:hypothetical protein
MIAPTKPYLIMTLFKNQYFVNINLMTAEKTFLVFEN